VVVKTEQFLAVLKDPSADSANRAEALPFVIHFIGGMHQPLHDEDDGDKRGNARQVVFDGHPEQPALGLGYRPARRHQPEPQALAAELERRITPQDRAEWKKGTIEDWAMEGHRLAQRVAYGGLEAVMMQRSPRRTSSRQAW
jgi:nuclease S1